MKEPDICLVSDLVFYKWRNVLSRGVAKKAARGDDLETLVAKKGFSGDGGKGRFTKGPAKAQVTDGLSSAEAIIHFAIVTAGALFDQPSSLPRPFLASALPNPSLRGHFLASALPNPSEKALTS